MTEPTVPERYDGPEGPKCPDCGLIPDTTRATCLTCLRGPVPEHPGDLDGTALAPVDFDLPGDDDEPAVWCAEHGPTCPYGCIRR